MSKRLVSFLLAFIMLIGNFTPAFANGIIIGNESNDAIINNSDESNDTIINNEENIDNNNSLYENEKNDNENLESSITTENGAEADENSSSLVIDNNNVTEKNQETKAFATNVESNIEKLIEDVKMTVTTLKDSNEYSEDFTFKMEENK